MKELINELVEKVGLTEEKATQSVETVMAFVKNKLPDGLSSQVENLFSGQFDLSSLFGGGSSKDGDDKGGSNPLSALNDFLKK